MALNADILAADIKARRDAVLDAYVNRPDYTPDEAADFRLALAKADAEAWIYHLHTYGEIASLTVTMAGADGPGHVHPSAATTTATGKIS